MSDIVSKQRNTLECPQWCTADHAATDPRDRAESDRTLRHHTATVEVVDNPGALTDVRVDITQTDDLDSGERGQVLVHVDEAVSATIRTASEVAGAIKAAMRTATTGSPQIPDPEYSARFDAGDPPGVPAHVVFSGLPGRLTPDEATELGWELLHAARHAAGTVGYQPDPDAERLIADLEESDPESAELARSLSRHLTRLADLEQAAVQDDYYAVGYVDGAAKVAECWSHSTRELGGATDDAQRAYLDGFAAGYVQAVDSTVRYYRPGRPTDGTSWPEREFGRGYVAGIQAVHAVANRGEQPVSAETLVQRLPWLYAPAEGGEQQ